MCGRFALATEKHILEMLYHLEIRDDLQPRYNIAPSQKILACRLSPRDGKRELAAFKWGLVPFWARDDSIGSRMINARSETVTEKPSFREAFKKRRLLIPVSGFYEWKNEGSVKQPYFICRKDGKPFSLAGLWDLWNKGGGTPLESCTILTAEPNALVASLHDRMPVIISPETYGCWLDPGTDSATLQEMLAPYPTEELTAYPVAPLVNNPANDSPDLIKIL